MGIKIRNPLIVIWRNPFKEPQYVARANHPATLGYVDKAIKNVFDFIDDRIGTVNHENDLIKIDAYLEVLQDIYDVLSDTFDELEA